MRPLCGQVVRVYRARSRRGPEHDLELRHRVTIASEDSDHVALRTPIISLYSEPHRLRTELPALGYERLVDHRRLSRLDARKGTRSRRVGRFSAGFEAG